jgi:hypothetical protein
MRGQTEAFVVSSAMISRVMLSTRNEREVIAFPCSTVPTCFSYDRDGYITTCAAAPFVPLDGIENCLFRELKQGFNLWAFPKKTADVVRGHVYLTILTSIVLVGYQPRQCLPHS